MTTKLTVEIDMAKPTKSVFDDILRDYDLTVYTVVDETDEALAVVSLTGVESNLRAYLRGIMDGMKVLDQEREIAHIFTAAGYER